MEFLPINKEEMEQRGWDRPDFVLVTGDAYVDHPSFGAAIISRVLEAFGYKVAILAQPDISREKDFTQFNEPKLAFLVTSGNIDSMVNHYSVAKKKRTEDSYTPGKLMGKRPDRATIVYSKKIRSIYKNTPIILGGIEASLRRLSHYDYWSDKVMKSILIDSQADILVYGMGERIITDIAEALAAGIMVKDITYIPGTVYKTDSLESLYEFEKLPSFKEISESRKKFAQSFKLQYENTDAINGKILTESYGEDLFVVQNTAALPLDQKSLDHIYSLNYMRNYHPSYESMGGIAAIEEVKFSLISNRGCFGGCNFCALTFHQGRVLQSRSHNSMLEEAEKIIQDKDFKGYIHDVGGPTANFRHRACERQENYGVCKTKQCLFPVPCKNLKIDHEDYLELLTKLKKLPNVKKVFVRSGIRFDYLIYDKNKKFFKALCRDHISGQLKVAPEHISDKVLAYMGKPKHEIYKKFTDEYHKYNEEIGKNQFLVPYLMSSHPGSTLKDAIELAEYLRDINHAPQQVQDFYPTPSTVSTCMYYTGINPLTMESVYVPKSHHEKAMQRALIQYRNPKNYNLVYEALILAKREDLIGFHKKALIRPKAAFKNQDFNKNKPKDEKKAVQKRKAIRNVHKKKNK